MKANKNMVHPPPLCWCPVTSLHPAMLEEGEAGDIVLLAEQELCEEEEASLLTKILAPKPRTVPNWNSASRSTLLVRSAE